MATTNFDVYLQAQVKKQQNTLLKLNNHERKQLLKLERDNMQIMFKLQHEHDVEEIKLLNEEIEMETLKQRREIHAMKEQSKKVIEAENQKMLAERRAQKKATEILKAAEAYKEQHHIHTDTQVQIIKSNAEARLAVAESKCEALTKEANAESQNSEQMEGLRKHNEKLKMAKTLKAMAHNGHMIVSGKNGQDVLNFYNETLD